jgi:hypothetical protein
MGRKGWMRLSLRPKKGQECKMDVKEPSAGFARTRVGLFEQLDLCWWLIYVNTGVEPSDMFILVNYFQRYIKPPSDGDRA